MDDCVYLHWAGDGPQALSQRIDLRSHLGAVLESHFTTRYWKRYHSKRLRHIPVFSTINYDVYDVINLFYFQHLTICFISYLTWSSIRRTRRKSWAIFWRAPSPMTASRQNSFTGELFELFFRVKNRANLNSCQKQFPSSNSCMTWTFLRQSNPRAFYGNSSRLDELIFTWTLSLQLQRPRRDERGQGRFVQGRHAAVDEARPGPTGQRLGSRRWRPASQVSHQKNRPAAQRVPLLRRHQGSHQMSPGAGGTTFPPWIGVRGKLFNKVSLFNIVSVRAYV